LLEYEKRAGNTGNQKGLTKVYSALESAPKTRREEKRIRERRAYAWGGH